MDVRLGVTVIIENPEGEILIVKHTTNNGWSFVSGGIENSETAIEAAIRETQEESGIIIDPAKILPTEVYFDFNYRDGRKGRQSIFYYFSTTKNTNLNNPKEITNLAWISPLELRNYLIDKPGLYDLFWKIHHNYHSPIIFTGGGSGGHLAAATAVIDELKLNYPKISSNILYVGGIKGMINDPTPSIESRKVPDLGIKFIGIRSGKLHRVVNIYMFKLLIGVIGGFIDSLRLLLKYRPVMIFSTGGYVSVPIVIVGFILGIKIIIHEQTIVSGLANRISAKFATKILISFSNSAKYFSTKKTILTGNPIQASRFNNILPKLMDSSYRTFLETPSTKPFIFLTGGGLGSHKLNNWVLNNILELSSNYKFLIQTGENELLGDYAKLQTAKETLPLNNQANIFIIKWFSKEIGYIYSQADLVICRPGANTVLELLATNRKAALVPISWSSANEQQLNAEYFIANQTGAIVAETEISTQLYPVITNLIKLKSKKTEHLVKVNAVKEITNIILTQLA